MLQSISLFASNWFYHTRTAVETKQCIIHSPISLSFTLSFTLKFTLSHSLSHSLSNSLSNSLSLSARVARERGGRGRRRGARTPSGGRGRTRTNRAAEGRTELGCVPCAVCRVLWTDMEANHSHICDIVIHHIPPAKTYGRISGGNFFNEFSKNSAKTSSLNHTFFFLFAFSLTRYIGLTSRLAATAIVRPHPSL